MLDFRTDQYGALVFEGPLFAADVPQSIRRRMADAVEELAEAGAAEVRSVLAAEIRRPTGFTAAGVEGFAYKHGFYATGSLYGKVRMRPGLRRGGSRSHPAERVPYIVARVLEGGHYGGQRGTRVDVGRGFRARRRSSWTAGSRQGRRAIHQFARAARVLRRRAALLRADLTRDLE